MIVFTLTVKLALPLLPPTPATCPPTPHLMPSSLIAPPPPTYSPPPQLPIPPPSQTPSSPPPFPNLLPPPPPLLPTPVSFISPSTTRSPAPPSCAAARPPLSPPPLAGFCRRPLCCAACACRHGLRLCAISCCRVLIWLLTGLRVAWVLPFGLRCFGDVSYRSWYVV